MHATRRPSLWLFLVFQALYALTSSGNVFRLADEYEVYFQVESLVDRGSLAVPQAAAFQVDERDAEGRVVRRSLHFGKIGVDGLPYAPYGPLAAVAAVPHHLVSRAVAWLAGVPREPLPGGRPWLVLVAGLTSLASATAAALAVTGFFRAASALGAAPASALLLSCLLGAATVVWPYGTSFYAESMVAAALVWATVALLEARADPPTSTSRVVAASFLLGLACLTKPTAVVFTPGFVVAAALVGHLDPKRKALAAISLAPVLATCLHLAYNAQRFGAPFDFGYNWGETLASYPARPFALDELPRGLAVLLLSPGKSLLLWAPALALAARRLRAAWEIVRPLAAGLLTSLVISLLFYGSYMFPEGGYCHGPRHLVPLVPLLLLPAVLPGRSVGRSGAVTCGVLGGTLAMLAVSVSFVQDQAMGTDFSSHPASPYYERIEAAPGRPWNRYDVGYVPFVNTLTSGQWGMGGPPGGGIDYFALHLARARATLPDFRAVPGWLPWAVAGFWTALLTAGVVALESWRRAAAPPVRHTSADTAADGR